MINILFSSHNGEKTLPIMLDAFCHLDVPISGWKIVAVDNVSTDMTADIIKSYADKLPITYLYEEKPGKNNALNSALKYIEDGLVVFTDDDVIPNRDWLTQLEKCANLNPEYTVFGGAIKPCWPHKPENWILEHVPLGVTYALTDEGREEGEIYPGLVWGPNMAIRKHVFDNGFFFNGGVGPNGKNYVMGSETEFTLRLSEAGYKSWFCSTAIVQHIIREHQLESEWIISRAYRFGRNMYRQESKDYDSKTPQLFGIPRWMFTKQVVYYKDLLIAFLFKNKAKANMARWEISFFNGYLMESKHNK